MTLQPKYISWLLVLILGSVIIFQYRGATKAEQRAEQLEAQAKDIDAQLHSFEQQQAVKEAQAESRYQASLAESANLRAILAKGSQKPITASPKNPSTIPPLTANEAAKSAPNAAEGQSSCTPLIYQGNPLVIDGFQVSVCDQKPVVQAEAAVALQDEKALVDKLNTQLADANAKLVLEDKDLAAYKAAEAGYKKAAKKSRIKKVLHVAEVVGLVAVSFYAGRKL